MTQNAKGPAATAIAPDRGSTNPTKDQEMNSQTNTTDLHPWEAARQHAKALSDTLSLCNDGDWYAHVFPSNRSYRVCFAAMPVGEAPVETAVDRVNRLAWELSHALNDYMDGLFQARIYPSSNSGYAVNFTVTRTVEREARP